MIRKALLANLLAAFGTDPDEAQPACDEPGRCASVLEHVALTSARSLSAYKMAVVKCVNETKRLSSTNSSHRCFGRLSAAEPVLPSQCQKTENSAKDFPRESACEASGGDSLTGNTPSPILVTLDTCSASDSSECIHHGSVRPLSSEGSLCSSRDLSGNFVRHQRTDSSALPDTRRDMHVTSPKTEFLLGVPMGSCNVASTPYSGITLGNCDDGKASDASHSSTAFGNSKSIATSHCAIVNMTSAGCRHALEPDSLVVSATMSKSVFSNEVGSSMTYSAQHDIGSLTVLGRSDSGVVSPRTAHKLASGRSKRIPAKKDGRCSPSTLSRSSSSFSSMSPLSGASDLRPLSHRSFLQMSPLSPGEFTSRTQEVHDTVGAACSAEDSVSKTDQAVRGPAIQVHPTVGQRNRSR